MIYLSLYRDDKTHRKTNTAGHMELSEDLNLRLRAHR